MLKQDDQNINEDRIEVAKQIQQDIFQKKKEFEALKKKTNQFKVLTFLAFTFFLIYITVFVVQPYAYSLDQIVSAFINNSFHFFFLLLICLGYITAYLFQKRTVQAEEVYYSLRHGFLEGPSDSCSTTETWKEKEVRVEVLKNKFDVNINTENK
jgi:uncharacterized membrane protein (DUF485 family)